ncbi:MAG: DNA-3-methyladenine glycosylase family protein [Terriglobia bacterium]
MQRRPVNSIDRWDGAAYRRVLVIDETPVSLSMSQASGPDGALSISLPGGRPDRKTASAIRRAVERALGLHVDLSDFYRLALRDRKLAPLADRFRGMKPPRFFSAFEGLVNGIACQQLSLSVGIQLLNRLAKRFGLGVPERDSISYAFPRPRELAGATPETIRKLGFNFNKARSLVEISRAIVEGRLDLENLQAASDEEALETLLGLRGVGRWTAEYTLLRGFGRWHIFPVDDQGARNGLARWLRLRRPLDAPRARRVLARWQPYGGMIYFYMLMNGLSEAGYLGRVLKED